jgi:hypothetical protein
MLHTTFSQKISAYASIILLPKCSDGAKGMGLFFISKSTTNSQLLIPNSFQPFQQINHSTTHQPPVATPVFFAHPANE